VVNGACRPSNHQLGLLLPWRCGERESASQPRRPRAAQMGDLTDGGDGAKLDLAGPAARESCSSMICSRMNCSTMNSLTEVKEGERLEGGRKTLVQQQNMAADCRIGNKCAGQRTQLYTLQTSTGIISLSNDAYLLQAKPSGLDKRHENATTGWIDWPRFPRIPFSSAIRRRFST
jgi:hypothetical protein